MRSPPCALALTILTLACPASEASEARAPSDAPSTVSTSSTVNAAPLPSAAAAPASALIESEEIALPPQLAADELARLNAAANQALRTRDFVTAATLLERACNAQDLAACMRFAELLDRGAGVQEDAARARQLYTRACSGGLQQACDQLGH
jgi:TPR repeat protein